MLAATMSLPEAKTLAFREPRQDIETTKEYTRPPMEPKTCRPKSFVERLVSAGKVIPVKY